MLLTNIHVDRARFQKRAAPWSEQTVEGIVAEGLIVAKFDPIPILANDDGTTYTVAGDGHSRFEAVRRLAELGKLPEAWSCGGDWDIPTKLVTEDEANRLKWTGNLSRAGFEPMEESRVYLEMQTDGGMSIEAIAQYAHRDVRYVTRMLRLNNLAACIQERVGKSADAGGIDKTMAQTMAELFERYKVGVKTQQEFFGDIFAHSELTPSLVRGAIHSICDRIAKMNADGAGAETMLFQMQPSVKAAIKELGERAKLLQRAERALKSLQSCLTGDVLDGIPELKSLLAERGDTMLLQLKAEADSDGAMIGAAAFGG